MVEEIASAAKRYQKTHSNTVADKLARSNAHKTCLSEKQREIIGKSEASEAEGITRLYATAVDARIVSKGGDKIAAHPPRTRNVGRAASGSRINSRGEENASRISRLRASAHNAIRRKSMAYQYHGIIISGNA